MLFDEPQKTPWSFLSLGAGVQSSTMALMAAHGEITPQPDAAIFADTQAEPPSVYRWLDQLEELLPFPIYRVSAGNLTQDALEWHTTKDGRRYVKTLIPVFTLGRDGSKGMINRRACTADYKIKPIRRKVKELAGIRARQQELTVTQWIGISLDEIQRMRLSTDAWWKNRWPLIEQRMTRADCLGWMKKNGYPTPPRSACVYCPYHSDREWRHLQTQEPEAFQLAIEFEHALQERSNLSENLRSTPFLHSSVQSLERVDFSSDLERGQMSLWQNFNVECEGMCGL